MNNTTLLTADRTTHVKIVAVALAASIAVSLVGLAVHVKTMESGPFSGPQTRTIMVGG